MIFGLCGGSPGGFGAGAAVGAALAVPAGGAALRDGSSPAFGRLGTTCGIEGAVALALGAAAGARSPSFCALSRERQRSFVEHERPYDARRPRPRDRVPRTSSPQVTRLGALLATGAEERPLVFGGNDRPGVMMAGAMRG